MLGFVPDAELAQLMAGARCLIMPSTFEAASFPIWEAMGAGVPVAASRVTSLPQQVGDAGLLFDPLEVEDIARQWKALWVDAGLRHDLAARATRQVAPFTWDLTADRFAAHYRELLGHGSLADRALLEREPQL
jgi:glycosyltransferase involved in cell wall biosynthesis